MILSYSRYLTLNGDGRNNFPATSGAPSISQISQQLIDQIVSELSDRHFGDLRVTSKCFYDATLVTWKKRALQEKDGRSALEWLPNVIFGP